jgi:hypothetical protein
MSDDLSPMLLDPVQGLWFLEDACPLRRVHDEKESVVRVAIA